MIKLTEVKASGEEFEETPFTLNEGRRIILFQEIEQTPEINVIGEASSRAKKFTMLVIEGISRPINVKESESDITALIKNEDKSDTQSQVV